MTIKEIVIYVLKTVLVLSSFIVLLLIAPFYLGNDLWNYIKTGKRKDHGWKGE